MAVAGSGIYRAGDTALVVTVPEAEPLVSGWRERFDSSAHAGVPAHVTVLYSFLDEHKIAGDVLATLERLMAAHDAFDVRFPRCGRFPNALFLAPSPEQPFRALTETVAAQWPEAPPYGGAFSEIIPHLTIAHDQDAAVFDEIASDVNTQLPIAAHISTVRLLACNGNQWHQRATFALR